MARTNFNTNSVDVTIDGVTLEISFNDTMVMMPKCRIALIKKVRL